VLVALPRERVNAGRRPDFAGCPALTAYLAVNAGRATENRG